MNSGCSIIATTYNQSKDLELYLLSLKRQSVVDFEIVIADDGSGPETAAVIRKFQQSYFEDRLVHVWHEDVGYRKSKIVNAAVKKAQSEWLIFTDSDHIVHPKFVEDHMSMSSKCTLFMGRRIDLSRQVSDWIRSHPDRLLSPSFYARIVASGSKNLNRAFRIGNPLISRLCKCGKVPDLLGSNFSISRKLLYDINGFDETREHYWGEDGDLFVRARNSGANIIGRKSFAVEFHLWHPQRTPPASAHADYQKTLSDRSYRRCVNGLTGAPLP